MWLYLAEVEVVVVGAEDGNNDDEPSLNKCPK